MALKEVTNGATNIKFISASSLNEAGVRGEILTGKYLGPVTNQLYGGEDHKFELQDGALAIVNKAGNLGSLLKNVTPGTLVQVTYEGMDTIKKGKFKGKNAHQFRVFAEDSEQAEQ